MREGGKTKQTAGRLSGVIERDRIALSSVRDDGGDITIISLLPSKTIVATPLVGGKQGRGSASRERAEKDVSMGSQMNRRKKNRGEILRPDFRRQFSYGA